MCVVSGMAWLWQGISSGSYSRGLLAAWTEKTASILCETELNRKAMGTVAAVQVGSAEVVVQQAVGTQHSVRAGIPVRVR